jgi:heme-degrading monooxygenase HmoA
VYASVRRYSGNAELAEALSSRADEVRSVISEIAGFQAYYLIDADGDAVTVSVFDSEAGAQQSNEAAAAWLKENMPDVAPATPEISAGEVVLTM